MVVVVVVVVGGGGVGDESRKWNVVIGKDMRICSRGSHAG